MFRVENYILIFFTRVLHVYPHIFSSLRTGILEIFFLFPRIFCDLLTGILQTFFLFPRIFWQFIDRYSGYIFLFLHVFCDFLTGILQAIFLFVFTDLKHVINFAGTRFPFKAAGWMDRCNNHSISTCEYGPRFVSQKHNTEIDGEGSLVTGCVNRFCKQIPLGRVFPPQQTIYRDSGSRCLCHKLTTLPKTKDVWRNTFVAHWWYDNCCLWQDSPLAFKT